MQTAGNGRRRALFCKGFCQGLIHEGTRLFLRDLSVFDSQQGPGGPSPAASKVAVGRCPGCPSNLASYNHGFGAWSPSMDS